MLKIFFSSFFPLLLSAFCFPCCCHGSCPSHPERLCTSPKHFLWLSHPTGQGEGAEGLVVLHFVLVFVNPGWGISYFFQVLWADRRLEGPGGEEKMCVPPGERSVRLGEISWGRRVAVMLTESAQVRRQGRFILFVDLLGCGNKVCNPDAVPQARNPAALSSCAAPLSSVWEHRRFSFLPSGVKGFMA